METKSIHQLRDRKWIIGMVHVGALPGTPMHSKPFQTIIQQAVEEALLLQDAGVDAILIENMHDVPYLKETVGPEIVACMTVVSVELRRRIHLPIGIQILAAANLQALAVAQSANLDFIRAEGFIFAHVADEGYLESCAGELLRYRKMLGAEHILIFTDVQKKHSSHAITSDLSLKDHVETAAYFRSDGVIITGTSTGKEALIEDVRIARQNTDLPVLVGSGITAGNIENYWDLADAFIVGSWFKQEGNWEKPVSEERVKAFMNKVQDLRTKE
ncbi:MAG: BtpA/SgcQ family protein [Bacteroidota bacterium]|nr:BtpA/SgcQ family protein [Bacteroidota bacterium]